MATTTAFGYKVPDTGDLASVWMQDLADNWTRISAHTHDGADSASLDVTVLSKLTSTILSAAWASAGGGNFTQVITVPGAILEINDFHIYFYITSTGERLFPDVTRASATTYTLGVNDNTLAITAVYI